MSQHELPTTWEGLPPLLTVRQVARLTGFSEYFVYESLRSGSLRSTAYRLGRSVRVKRDALRELIEREQLD